MTTRPPSDSDYWYDPDTTGAAVLRQIREAGEYRRSDPPAPVPEGMETTQKERRQLMVQLSHRQFDGLSPTGMAVIRDLDRALAEIARLGTQLDDALMEIVRLTERVAYFEREYRRSDPPAPVPEGMETTLQRWGLPSATRNAEQCADGYWTPWHIAQAALDRALAEIARLKQWEAVLVKERSENHEIYRALAEANAAEIARLTERVAYFEREYQDSVSRTEAIENVETAKTEIARLTAQPPFSPADGWRAIESAPLGELVLLTNGTYVDCGRVGYLFGNTQAGRPTHWLPIPSPPAEETKT